MLSGKQKMKFGHYLTMVLLSSTIAGCSVLPQSEGLQSYLLPAHPGGTITSETQTMQPLRITTPQTSQFLNSLRIAVQPDGNEISVYKGVRWNDTVPVVVRERLLEEFRQSNAFKWISSEQNNLRIDKELRSDLTDFQLVYSKGGSKVFIRLNASLINSNERTILASRTFEIEQPVAAGHTTAEMITAFGLACDQLSQQVLRWSIGALK